MRLGGVSRTGGPSVAPLRFELSPEITVRHP